MRDTLAATADELSQLLADTPFTSQLGLRLLSIDYGACTIEAPFRADYERPGGIVSGQVIMATADVAMWLAIKTRRGLDDPSVTANMSSVFLSAARQESIRCSATVIKWGRRLVVGTVQCTNEAGELLSHHTISYSTPA